MKTYKKVKVEQEKLATVRCDRCGENFLLPHEFLAGGALQPHFGYGSKHDGSCSKIDLCDNCYTLFIQDFLGEVPF